MYKLNLPPFKIILKPTAGKQQVYDVLRRKYVALTPEEWVRQHFVHFLCEHKGYPLAYMANEVELSVGAKKLRCEKCLTKFYVFLFQKVRKVSKYNFFTRKKNCGKKSLYVLVLTII